MITNSELAITLALHSEAMRVPSDAVLFQPGEVAEGVYIVRSGRFASLLRLYDSTVIITVRHAV